jgi:hypothetical protein
LRDSASVVSPIGFTTGTTLNNITAKKSDNGSVAIQFGGCDGKIPNCLLIVAGWNYRCGCIARAPRF